jgi:hypothetical protein
LLWSPCFSFFFLFFHFSYAVIAPFIYINSCIALAAPPFIYLLLYLFLFLYALLLFFVLLFLLLSHFNSFSLALLLIHLAITIYLLSPSSYFILSCHLSS